jgi:hypothetical protein
MEQYISQIDNKVNNILRTYVTKPTIIKGIVHLLLVLYAVQLAPELPKPVQEVFKNAYFRLFIFSLILWSAQFSPSISIAIAIGFMVTMNYINNKPLWEFMENISPATAPIAPSKEVAVSTTSAIMETQSIEPQMVNSVAQMQETVVIQPSIVSTPDGGSAVLNPTVVVAPAIVSAPSGEQLKITPEVTMMEQSPAPAPMPTQSKEQQSEPAQCYPTRKYDMSKVNAYESVNYHTIS